MARRPNLRQGRDAPQRRAVRRQTSRASTTARGYGRSHQKLRARIAPTVAAGLATCWRCGERIAAGEKFHLGHDDDDRTKYRGPEHVKCNVGAAQRRRFRRQGQTPPTTTQRRSRALKFFDVGNDDES
jgi:hypothetical protein